MHALQSPLPDFGLHPSNGAWPKSDGCWKALSSDQLIDARFRETRDRFHFRQPNKCHVIRDVRRPICWMWLFLGIQGRALNWFRIRPFVYGNRISHEASELDNRPCTLLFRTDSNLGQISQTAQCHPLRAGTRPDLKIADFLPLRLLLRSLRANEFSTSMRT
jgi:hypothetical protein